MPDERVTPKAQAGYHLLARIESICRDMQEAQPEQVAFFVSRLWLVLVILDTMGRFTFPGWVSHVDAMKCRGHTPKDVSHRF